MKIAQGIEMLEISADVMGSPKTIYPTLIWDKETVILVDTGYPGQLPQLREAAEKTGVSFDELSKIIITHQDIDHVGSLTSILKEQSGKIEVLAHEEEKPYIGGDKCPTKLAKLEAQLEVLPAEMKLVYEKLKAGFAQSRANVDKMVKDGEELPFCGGIMIIHTPGHTPGHISLYHKSSKTLIAGDILMVENGQLTPAPEFINFDHAMSKKSLQKLTRYDIENLICYHGGLFIDDVNNRIAQLVGQSDEERD